MWQHPHFAPPGRAPEVVQAMADTAAWNRTVDKVIALEVDATRNDIAHAVWSVMTSKPWALSNSALLSGEVRRVLAACSNKHSELDKVRADLARQQNDLDMRKLELKSKQNKVDKQQKQLHKFEKWFLQVDAIEGVERVSQESKLGPKSETDTEDDAEADTGLDWNHPVTNEEWVNPVPVNAFKVNQMPANASTNGWPPAPVQEVEYYPAPYVRPYPASYARPYQASYGRPMFKAESPVKVNSFVKDQSPVKDASSVKDTLIVDEPLGKEDHKSILDHDNFWRNEHHLTRLRASLAKNKEAKSDKHNDGGMSTTWNDPTKSVQVDEWQQRNVDNSTNKLTESNYHWNDKSDKNKIACEGGTMGYHWDDGVPKPTESVASFARTKVSNGPIVFKAAPGPGLRDSGRPRRVSSVLRQLDELTSKSVNDRAEPDQPDNADKSTNVDDWNAPAFTWTDDENDDQLPGDKVTEVDVGESVRNGSDAWVYSDHGDADDLTTWDMPVVTPESSKAGSSTRHPTVGDNLTTLKMPVVATEPSKSGSGPSGSGTRHPTVGDNLTTLKMPVVATESSKAGSGTRHPTVGDNLTTLKMPVVATEPSKSGSRPSGSGTLSRWHVQKNLARGKSEEEYERKQRKSTRYEQLSRPQYKSKARLMWEEHKMTLAREKELARERELARKRELASSSSPTLRW